jgi:hypothetical protein
VRRDHKGRQGRTAKTDETDKSAPRVPLAHKACRDRTAVADLPAPREPQERRELMVLPALLGRLEQRDHLVSMAIGGLRDR